MSYVKTRGRAMGPPPGRSGGFVGIVGNSPALKEALERLEALLRADVPAVVLEGETGTGKTLLARAAHDWRGTHRRPFLFFPTPSLPPHLLENQLFGTPLGAPGLLALAEGGTLVLEDADALPRELQDGLSELFPSLRLEEEEIINLEDEPELPLVVFTTRKALLDELGSVPFHSPLADALKSVRVTLPPLRKREGDVERLARHFLRDHARRHGEPERTLMPEALEALQRHPWPGNVRELRDTLERAVTLAPGSVIRLEHLRIRTRATRPLDGEEGKASEVIVLPPEGKTLEEIEAEAVKATLEITQGNRSQAARILGVSRPTLARKIRKYHLNGSR
jgi:DNA-binding NtrC family response regulator